MWLFHLHSAVKSISKLRSAYRTEFYLHNTVKRQPFSPGFPLADFMAEAFFRLFLWNFKEKSINLFLGRVVIFVYNYLKPLKNNLFMA